MNPLIKFSFAILFTAAACSEKQRTDVEDLSVVFVNGKAVKVMVQPYLINDINPNSITFRIAGDSISLLGKMEQLDGLTAFVPHVPMTRGMTYEMVSGSTVLASVSIPLDEQASEPSLTIFPSADTLPENLLKVYFVFSEPMVEARSLDHIRVITDKNDTLSGTFLDLQPELWNNSSTMLTLWLDPGRIKRDLIPNQKLGNPLVRGRRYRFVVDHSWKSKAGKPLSRTVEKSFVVTSRDEQSPRPTLWRVSQPGAETSDRVSINFGETLDYSLLSDALYILNERQELITGEWIIGKEEKSILFIPVRPWSKGTYTLQVESRLEDAAGNNLTRLFDADITAAVSAESSTAVKVPIVIR